MTVLDVDSQGHRRGASSTRTVYGSESQRVYWHSVLRYPSERSMVLYNAVDPAHFVPDETEVRSHDERRRLGVPPHGFVVGTVARPALCAMGVFVLPSCRSRRSRTQRSRRWRWAERSY